MSSSRYSDNSHHDDVVMKPYSSEEAFLKARRYVRQLAGITLASSAAQILLAELCELCLSPDMALSMLESGLLDEVALIFRHEQTYTVQLTVTVLICICLKSRRGRVYYERNVKHCPKFLVDMLKNTLLVEKKLNRYYESSNIAKSIVLPLAFTAYSWPSLVIPDTSAPSNVYSDHETMGRTTFESAKRSIVEGDSLPGLLPYAEVEFVGNQLRKRGRINSAFTVSSIASDALFLLLDAGQPLRNAFKRFAVHVQKAKTALLRDPLNYKLFHVAIMLSTKPAREDDMADEVLSILWNAFHLYTTSRVQYSLEGRYALEALMILYSRSTERLSIGSKESGILQKYLLGLDENDDDDTLGTQAWGLALLLGESVITRDFLALIVAQMLKKFELPDYYSKGHAWSCWAVATYFLQGYIEMPIAVVSEMLDRLVRLHQENKNHGIEGIVRELEEQLPSSYKAEQPTGKRKTLRERGPSNKRVRGTEATVGLSARFLWGLSSQFYLPLINSECGPGPSPFRPEPVLEVTMSDLYTRVIQEDELEPPRPVRSSDLLCSSPPEPEEEPLQAGLLHPSYPSPQTPPMYSSDATIDWTPKSATRIDIRGFKESRQPQKVPPPLKLRPSESCEPKVVLEPVSSALFPTFTAMYGTFSAGWGNEKGLTVPGSARVPLSAFRPPQAETQGLNEPPSAVLLFSVTPTNMSRFDPSLNDVRSYEPSSAFLKSSVLSSALPLSDIIDSPVQSRCNELGT